MRELFQYVTGRASGDCGVASLAMFLGVTYEQALEYLEKFGPVDVDRGISITHLALAATEYDELTVITPYRDVNKPAVVCVLSPGAPDEGHAVYWDGEEFWDPVLGAVIDQEYVDGHCYAQIQRISDMVDILASRTGAAVRKALQADVQNTIVGGKVK